MKKSIQHHLSEGLNHQMAGRLKEAESCYRLAESIDPSHPDVLHHLGVLAQAVERDELALEYFEKAETARPDDPEILNNMGITLKNLSRVPEAILKYEKAIALNPDLAPLYNNLGAAFMALNQFPMARENFQKAIDLKSDYVDAMANLGFSLSELQEYDLAREVLYRALSIQPGHIDSLRYLTSLDNDAEQTNDIINIISELLKTRKFSADTATRLQFLLAYLYDDIKNFKASEYYLLKANREKNEQLRESEKIKLDDHANALIDFFDINTITRLSHYAQSDQKHLFIVGLPRSGKSLLEHLLANHPDVTACGEQHLLPGDLLNDLPVQVQSKADYPTCLHETTQSDAQAIVNNYESKLNRLFDINNKWACNTMPYNFQHLGLITALLKNARVIFCNRDPDDQAFFIFQKFFLRGHGYSYDLKSLRDYQHQHNRLMVHWKLLLHDRLMEVSYESLVKDPKKMLKNVCNFLELDYGPIRTKELESNSSQREITAEWIGYARNYPSLYKKYRYKSDGKHNAVICKAIEKTDFKAAERFCYSILAEHPADIATLHYLGVCKLQQRKPADARIIFKHIARIRSVPEYLNSLGIACRDSGHFEEALQAYDQAISLRPNYAEAFNNRAVTLNDLNRTEEAIENLRTAYKYNPDYLTPLLPLTHHTKSKILPESLLKTIQDAIVKCEDNSEDHARLLFALGKHFEGANENERAWDYFFQANEVMKNHRPSRMEDHREQFNQTYSYQPVPGIVQAPDNPDCIPVFIIGLPRSGKTLLESILSELPRFHALGERDWLLNLVKDRLDHRGGYPKGLQNMHQAEWQQIRNDYLYMLQEHGQGKQYLINTFPYNFFYIGVICQCFPEAVIIHSQRGAEDMGLSIYFKYFERKHGWSYSLTEIGMMIRQHSTIMAQWNQNLPERIQQLDYESLILEPMESIQTLLQSCFGLAVPDRELHAILEAISLSSEGIDHWKKYRNELTPLLQTIKKPF